MGSKRNPMPPGRWQEVMDRDRYCRAREHGAPGVCEGRLEVHHRLNRGSGGSLDPAIHDLDKLLLVCSAHHHWITHHPAECYDLGLLMRHTT